MSRNSLFYIVIALALAILAALTIRTAVATSSTVSLGQSSYDEVERARANLHQAPADTSIDEVEKARANLYKAPADTSYDDVERARAKLPPSLSLDKSYDEVERGRATFSTGAQSPQWQAIDDAYRALYPNLTSQTDADFGAFLRSEALNERYGLPRAESGVANAQPNRFADASYDEVERGRAEFQAVGAPDLSDYWLRHREELGLISRPDLSDYALRHPGVTINLASEPDLSDYALRHPGIVPPAAR